MCEGDEGGDRLLPLALPGPHELIVMAGGFRVIFAVRAPQQRRRVGAEENRCKNENEESVIKDWKGGGYNNSGPGGGRVYEKPYACGNWRQKRTFCVSAKYCMFTSVLLNNDNRYSFTLRTWEKSLLAIPSTMRHMVVFVSTNRLSQNSLDPWCIDLLCVKHPLLRKHTFQE